MFSGKRIMDLFLSAKIIPEPWLVKLVYNIPMTSIVATNYNIIVFIEQCQ